MPSTSSGTRYALHVGAVSVESGDGFSADLLRRVVEAPRSTDKGEVVEEKLPVVKEHQ